MGATCKAENGKLVISAYFSDDTPARRARVSLRSKEHVLVRGKTNNEGIWTTPLPKPGKYKVIVVADGAHQITFPITLSVSNTGVLHKEIPSAPSENHSHKNQVRVQSNQPSREEFTAFPWFNVLLGLGVISLLALGMILVVRYKRADQMPSTKP